MHPKAPTYPPPPLVALANERLTHCPSKRSNPMPGWERVCVSEAGGGVSVTYHIRNPELVHGGGAGGGQSLRKMDLSRLCLPALLACSQDVDRFLELNPGCSVRVNDFDFATRGPCYKSEWKAASPPQSPAKEEATVEAGIGKGGGMDMEVEGEDEKKKKKKGKEGTPGKGGKGKKGGKVKKGAKEGDGEEGGEGEVDLGGEEKKSKKREEE